MLHFNLPFEKESLEPSRRRSSAMAGGCFEEITGIKLSELNLNIWIDEFMRNAARHSRVPQALADLAESIGYIIDRRSRTGVDRIAGNHGQDPVPVPAE
ncbi:MAG: hypothetical protein ACLTZY_14410 [Alistipes indistinctus]